MLSVVSYFYVHLQQHQGPFVISKALEFPNHSEGLMAVIFFFASTPRFLPTCPVSTQKKIFQLVSKEEFCSAQMDGSFPSPGLDLLMK